MGDLSATRDSPSTIRVRLSTTHPAMHELFVTTFGRYGHCASMPDEAYLPNHYCWKLATNLDNSFEFILHLPKRLDLPLVHFYAFLAGYSDSEGCWCIYGNKGHPAFAFVLESKDTAILNYIRCVLRRVGFHPLFYPSVGRGKGRLELRRRAEVASLADRLVRLSKHQEKVGKMSLILNANAMSWNDLKAEVRRLKVSIAREVAEFVKQAEIQYKKAEK